MKLLIAVAVLALGCGKKSDKEKPQDKPITKPDPPTLKKCIDPGSGHCNYVACGGNSMQINAFPVNGIRPDGECNLDQIQLVPGTMEGGVGDKCKGGTLDIEGNALVGRGAA